VEDPADLVADISGAIARAAAPAHA
jgi:hypothetical protein